MPSSRTLAATVALVAATVLSGCVTALEPVPAAAPRASVAPLDAGADASDDGAAPADVEAVPIAERPQPQVPIACDEIDGAAAIDDLFGVESSEPYQPTPYFDALAEQRGAVSCSWWSDRAADPVRFDVSIARHAAVSQQTWRSHGAGAEALPGSIDGELRCDEQLVASCRADAVVGDFGVWAYLASSASLPPAGGLEGLRARFLDTVSPVLDALATREAAPAWQPVDGALPAPFDCASLDAAAPRIAAALGVPSVVVQDVTALGEDYTLTPEEAELGGQTRCFWSQPGSDREASITAHLLSSGGWLFDELIDATATEVELAGADRAVRTASGQLIARIGPDAIAFQPGLMYAQSPPTAEQELAAAAAITTALARR
jgi:hypothetical protein